MEVDGFRPCAAEQPHGDRTQTEADEAFPDGCGHTSSLASRVPKTLYRRQSWRQARCRAGSFLGLIAKPNKAGSESRLAARTGGGTRLHSTTEPRCVSK